jgi:hypothetical protein
MGRRIINRESRLFGDLYVQRAKRLPSGRWRVYVHCLECGADYWRRWRGLNEHSMCRRCGRAKPDSKRHLTKVRRQEARKSHRCDCCCLPFEKGTRLNTKRCRHCKLSWRAAYMREYRRGLRRMAGTMPAVIDLISVDAALAE